jgi:hypothetical protein
MRVRALSLPIITSERRPPAPTVGALQPVLPLRPPLPPVARNHSTCEYENLRSPVSVEEVSLS